VSAVKLVTWRLSGDDPAPTGSLEWSNGAWIVTGDAGWLIDEYVAVLPTDEGPRKVNPAEGIPFLYAASSIATTRSEGLRASACSVVRRHRL
jgi:hypothetical protein